MSEHPRSSKVVAKLYNAAYKVGFSPWDVGPPKPELVALIEGESALTPGRAVDLGCGAGTKSVYLAEHGWRVTGVDISPEAIRQAEEKAKERGLDIDFIRCDLADIPDSTIGERFDLLLDIGCCHSLRTEVKGRYAANVATLAAPGATLFMFAFTKGPLSVTRNEIDTFFAPHWTLVSAVPGSERRTPDAGPMWYSLRRGD
jgi:cyclopropane fatty-acyl-phospholipid synthase-like methyltransferase